MALDFHVGSWKNGDYDLVHLYLALVYYILCLVSFVLLLRKWNTNRSKLIWQRMFYPLLCLGSLLRAVFFTLQPFVMEKYMALEKFSNGYNIILNDIPAFLFFTDYLIILFLWVEIYHSDSAVRMNTTPLFTVANLIIYITVLVLMSLDLILYPQRYNNDSYSITFPEKCIVWFDALLYSIASIAFVIYGLSIYFSFTAIPNTSPVRREALRKIGLFTILICFCFIIRACITTLGSFINLSEAFWFDGVYFTFLEVAPLALMIKILHRGNPPKNSIQSEDSPLISKP